MKSFTAMARTLVLGVLLAWSGAAAAQQVYPHRPIRIIVPYPPAGATDIVARLVGPKLAESLSQPVIVDNRPGGSTTIGTEALARSPRDGYTIMAVNSTHLITALLLPTSYDAIKDFAAVGTIGSTEYILALHPAVPADDLQQLISLAKSKPGQLNYSSAGRGGSIHLVSELFNIVAGVNVQHIPYKGGGPAITDLIGGQVQMSFQPPNAVVSHAKSGKLKAIAITGDKRSPSLPQVPTLTEAGLSDFDVKTWFGILAPAGTPKEIVDKLSAEIARIVAMPDIRNKLDSQGMDPFISSAEQFAALMKTDMVKWGKVIKTADIKIDQ